MFSLFRVNDVQAARAWAILLTICLLGAMVLGMCLTVNNVEARLKAPVVCSWELESCWCQREHQLQTFTWAPDAVCHIQQLKRDQAIVDSLRGN